MAPNSHNIFFNYFNPRSSPSLTLLRTHVSMVRTENRKSTTSQTQCMHLFWYVPKMRQHDLSTTVLVTIVQLTNHILCIYEVWKWDKHLLLASLLSVKVTINKNDESFLVYYRNSGVESIRLIQLERQLTEQMLYL